MEFENTKMYGNFSLLDVVRVDRNLVISPHEVNLGADGAARKAMGIIYVCV